jgi:hypothetical protein
MRFKVDVIGAMVARAEEHVNAYFNQLSLQDAQRSQEHRAKRLMAESILSGSDPHPAFLEAAEIEGVHFRELARTVASKPDDVMILANRRRSIILRVRAAKSQAELDQILMEEGVEELAPGMYRMPNDRRTPDGVR